MTVYKDNGDILVIPWLSQRTLGSELYGLVEYVRGATISYELHQLETMHE